MDNSQQIESLEVSMDEAKEMIKDRDTLLKLLNNNAFKRVIGELYYVEELSRLVDWKVNATSEIQEKNVDKMICGVGALKNFFSAIIHRAAQAESALREDQETREEILAEDVN